MAHEESITIDMDGKFFNIPTVHKGKKVSHQTAIRLFREGKIRALGKPSGFKDRDTAISAAVARSENFPPPILGQRKRRGLMPDADRRQD